MKRNAQQPIKLNWICNQLKRKRQMKVSPKNIEYQEFLSIISGIKTIEKHTILLNYDDTIIGTIEQLKEFAKELENLDFKRFVFELDGKVNKEISDTEIKKYLKRLTDNFDVELTKSALFELEVFENMVFHETIDEVLQQKYLDEGWEIPTYETKNPITRKKVKICDYKKMRTKVFPFIGMQLYTAKKYLQDNIPPQQSQNQKPIPELNKALISFSSPEIIRTLHDELKGYFQGFEAELLKAFKGEQLPEFLLFPHNQNKFVEIFKRLKYNGLLLSTPKETKDWICSTFTYQYQKGGKKEVRNFNSSTVHDILTKDKGEPTKKERICIVDWLPYKSHLTRQRESEKENF